jgi:competence protein ComEA
MRSPAAPTDPRRRLDRVMSGADPDPGPARPPDHPFPDWIVEGEEHEPPGQVPQLSNPRPAVSRGAAVVAALIAVVALVVAVPRVLSTDSEPQPLPPRPQPAPSAAASMGTARAASASAPPATSAPGSVVLVHVVGQVRDPGLVRLATGARVADALDEAGGPTRRADLSAVNLARAVADGEQVFVPAPGQSPPAAHGPAPSGSAGGAPIDLNTATEADLDALPGVGPVIAGRIVAWRQEHGRFGSVDELTEVSGIGEATLERLRPLVRT